MTTIIDRDSLAAYMRSWTARRDIPDADINLQIELAEVRLNQDLRTADQIVRAYGFLDADYQTLPDDYLEMTRVTIRAQNREFPLRMSTDYSIFSEFPSAVSGIPEVYAIIGGQLQVRPIQSEAFEYEITYYRAIPTLTAGNVTSIILDKYPQLYMYSALIELSTYLKDDEQKDRWAGLYLDALTRVKKQNKRGQQPTPGRVIVPGNRRIDRRASR